MRSLKQQTQMWVTVASPLYCLPKLAGAKGYFSSVVTDTSIYVLKYFSKYCSDVQYLNTI